MYGILYTVCSRDDWEICKCTLHTSSSFKTHLDCVIPRVVIPKIYYILGIYQTPVFDTGLKQKMSFFFNIYTYIRHDVLYVPSCLHFLNYYRRIICLYHIYIILIYLLYYIIFVNFFSLIHPCIPYRD